MLGLRRKKWTEFKNLNNAIRLAKQRGAIVEKGGKSNGIRFDATVIASYHGVKYLIVVDLVKSPGPITKKDALDFATKSEKAGAQLAILASSTGFQEDCNDVSQKYGTRLLTSEIINASSPDTLTKAFDLVLNLHSFCFHLEDNKTVLAIPEEPGVLRMFMEEMKIIGPNLKTNVRRLLDDASAQVGLLATGKQQTLHLPLPEGTVIIHPNTGQKKQ